MLGQTAGLQQWSHISAGYFQHNPCHRLPAVLQHWVSGRGSWPQGDTAGPPFSGRSDCRTAAMISYLCRLLPAQSLSQTSSCTTALSRWARLTASRGYCRLSFQCWVRLQDCSNDLVSLQVTSCKIPVTEREIMSSLNLLFKRDHIRKSVRNVDISLWFIYWDSWHFDNHRKINNQQQIWQQITKTLSQLFVFLKIFLTNTRSSPHCRPTG